MIQVDLFFKDKVCIGYASKGHAESEDAYSDVVCAAVSVLLYTIAETLQDKVKVPVEIREGEGTFYLQTEEAHRDDVQLLFETLKIGLLGIYREYPEFISVFVKEVPC